MVNNKDTMVFKKFVSRGVLNQYIAGISACLCVVTSSSSHGWIAPLLEQLLGPDSLVPMTPIQSSWIVSVIMIGNMLSAIPAGILCNYIGRKPVLLLTGPLNFVSWLLIIYFPSAVVLGIARVIQGLSVGLAFTAGPIYLGEVSSSSNRGAIASLFYNAWWLGLLLDYIVGPHLTYYNFAYFTLALNVPFLLLFIWQPESPYFYLMKGDEENALSSLKWLRDSPEDKLREELTEIKSGMSKKAKSAGIKDLVATAADRKALTLLVVLTTVRLSSGSATLTIYGTRIFNLTPNHIIPPEMITVVFGLVSLVGGIFGSFTTDSLGRRPLLLLSCAGGFICLFLAGTYYLLLFHTSLDVLKFGWITSILTLGSSFLNSAGLSPVASVYTSELFTSTTRGIASSFSAVLIPVVCFVMLFSYQPITDYFGVFLNFYIYAFSFLIGFTYFYYFAPETKGKTFDEIRNELIKT